jgi:hypothetical protein
MGVCYSTQLWEHDDSIMLELRLMPVLCATDEFKIFATKPPFM